MLAKFKLKRDIFRKNRGGYSRFLNIYCFKCGQHILLYQKDGPGPLMRLYLDRIFAPDELVNTKKELGKIPNLVCLNCGNLIGTPSVFKKEKRKTFQLIKGNFSKKVGKGFYPPEE